MKQPIAAVSLALASIVALPHAARAQIGIESLFKDVTDVSLFYSCWNAKGPIARESCPSAKSGYGIEVIYNVGKIRLPGSGETTTPAGWSDTTRTSTCPANEQCGPASYVAYRKGEKATPHYFLNTELAFSYSQFAGFTSTDTSFDIRGSVREVPGFAMYFTPDAEEWPEALPRGARWFLEHFGPYAALKSGLIQLNTVQILDHGTPADTFTTSYKGSGLAFQFGGGGGLVFSLDRLNFFIEQTYVIKRFSSVTWDSKDNRIPKRFPSTLNFSGRTITGGVQLTLKK